MEDVESLIFGLRSNATSADSISLRILVLSCPQILPVVTHIINTCLLEGVFPAIWGEVFVTPIPKTQDCKELGDVHPISVLSPLSKILEKIVDCQLRVHLSIFNILPHSQWGFRPGYVCPAVRSSVIDDIVSTLDSHECTVLILLDYSKAFDTVDHQLMLSILHYIGLSDIAVLFYEGRKGLGPRAVNLVLGVSFGVSRRVR